MGKNLLNKKGYAIYLVVFTAACILILLFQIGNLFSGRSFRYETFYRNRQAYYLLKSCCSLVLSEASERLPLSSDFEKSTSDTVSEFLFNPSSELRATLNSMADSCGFTYPEIRISVISSKQLANPFYLDIHEKTGNLIFSFQTAYKGKKYLLNRKFNFRIHNLLPPVVSFFTLYSSDGFSSDINICESPDSCTVIYGDDSCIYTGKKPLDFKLTAGREEFHLPDPVFLSSGEIFTAKMNFCFSSRYRDFFKLSDMKSSILCLSGDNIHPSHPFLFGNHRKSFLNLSAVYQKNQDGTLGKYEFTIPDEGFVNTTGFSDSENTHQHLFYEKARDIMLCVDLNRNVFARFPSADIPLRKSLEAKTSVCLSVSEFKKKYLKNYLGNAVLDTKGEIIELSGELNLVNTRCISPCLILCKDSISLQNLSSDFPATFFSLEGDVTLAGQIDAFIGIFNPHRSLNTRNTSIRGGLYSTVLSPASLSGIFQITGNQQFYRYFSRESYRTVLISDGGNFEIQ